MAVTRSATRKNLGTQENSSQTRAAQANQSHKKGYKLALANAYARLELHMSDEQISNLVQTAGVNDNQQRKLRLALECRRNGLIKAKDKGGDYQLLRELNGAGKAKFMTCFWHVEPYIGTIHPNTSGKAIKQMVDDAKTVRGSQPGWRKAITEKLYEERDRLVTKTLLAASSATEPSLPTPLKTVEDDAVSCVDPRGFVRHDTSTEQVRVFARLYSSTNSEMRRVENELFCKRAQLKKEAMQGLKSSDARHILRDNPFHCVINSAFGDGTGLRTVAQNISAAQQNEPERGIHGRKNGTRDDVHKFRAVEEPCPQVEQLQRMVKLSGLSGAEYASYEVTLSELWTDLRQLMSEMRASVDIPVTH